MWSWGKILEILLTCFQLQRLTSLHLQPTHPCQRITWRQYLQRALYLSNLIHMGRLQAHGTHWRLVQWECLRIVKCEPWFHTTDKSTQPRLQNHVFPLKESHCLLPPLLNQKKPFSVWQDGPERINIQYGFPSETARLAFSWHWSSIIHLEEHWCLPAGFLQMAVDLPKAP